MHTDVKHGTGLSCSTIYLRIAEGRFPKPVRLGGRAVSLGVGTHSEERASERRVPDPARRARTAE